MNMYIVDVCAKSLVCNMASTAVMFSIAVLHSQFSAQKSAANTHISMYYSLKMKLQMILAMFGVLVMCTYVQVVQQPNIVK